MLINILELASNKALEHDSGTRERLKKLQGKTMALHVKTLEQSIAVTPQCEGLEFSSQIPEQVDVTLSTTVSAMIKISRDGLENAELDPGELEMSGDPIVGQRFAQVMADLNVDWQSLLAEQIGDAPAKTLTMVAGQAKEFVQESRGRLHDYVQDLVRNDMQIVASVDDVNTFLDEVDTLRADADHLQVKLTRLDERLKRQQN